MRTTVLNFGADDNGATAIEYGLIATLIAMVVLVGISATGGGVMAKWDHVMERINDAFGNGGEGGEGGGD